MKIYLVAVALFVFSLNTFADMDTTELGELEKGMTLQAGKIALAFDKNEIKTDSSIYQHIWTEEFNVIDYIEVVINTVELFNSVSDKSNGLVQMRARQNIGLMDSKCKMSLFEFKHNDEINFADIRSEVKKQTDYAKRACDAIEDFNNIFFKKLTIK